MPVLIKPKGMPWFKGTQELVNKYVVVIKHGHTPGYVNAASKLKNKIFHKLRAWFNIITESTYDNVANNPFDVIAYKTAEEAKKKINGEVFWKARTFIRQYKSKTVDVP